MPNRIKELRKEFSLKQNELGELINTTSTNLGHYETERRDMSTSVLKQLSSLLCVSIDYLLGMSDTGIIVIYEKANRQFIIDSSTFKMLSALNCIYHRCMKRYVNLDKLFKANKIEVSQEFISMFTTNLLQDLILGYDKIEDAVDVINTIGKIKNMDKDKFKAIKQIIDLIEQ